MTMILSGLDMTRYRESLSPKKKAGGRRKGFDVGIFFDFDPRKAKNHKLRGPLQTPFRVTAMVDGRQHTFKLPKGATMDNCGAMVVSQCNVTAASDVKVRVELVTLEQSRSSVAVAHKDYGRKLLRVIKDLIKKMPDSDSDDDAPPPPPRRMRTLKAPVGVAAALPELLITTRRDAAARRRRHRPQGLTPRTARATVPETTDGTRRPAKTSNLSSSVTSKSFRLIFGRIAFSRRASSKELNSRVETVR